MKNLTSRLLSYILIITTLYMSMWMPVAQATLITTDQITDSQLAMQNRVRVLAFFEREDVQTQLQARGVKTEDAKARVNAMTDHEIASINDHIDSLPAGGDALGGLVGALLFVFIVLLITDILGLTQVFSFTRSIRR